MRRKITLWLLSMPAVAFTSAAIACSSKHVEKYYSNINYSLFNKNAKITLVSKSDELAARGIYVDFNFIDSFNFWASLEYNTEIEDEELLTPNPHENNVKMTKEQYDTWTLIQKEIALFTQTLFKNSTISSNWVEFDDLFLNNSSDAISYSSMESLQTEFDSLTSERKNFLSKIGIVNQQQYYVFREVDKLSRTLVSYRTSDRLKVNYVWDNISFNDSQKKYHHSLTQGKYFFTDGFEPAEGHRYITTDDIWDTNLSFFNFKENNAAFESFINANYQLSVVNGLRFKFQSNEALTIGEAQNYLSGGASSEFRVWDSVKKDFIIYVRDATSENEFVHVDEQTGEPKYLNFIDPIYGFEYPGEGKTRFNLHLFLTKADAIDSFKTLAQNNQSTHWTNVTDDDLTRYQYIIDATLSKTVARGSYELVHKIVDDVTLSTPTINSGSIYVNNKLVVVQRGLNKEWAK